jgi:hypothetical protein
VRAEGSAAVGDGGAWPAAPLPLANGSGRQRGAHPVCATYAHTGKKVTSGGFNRRRSEVNPPVSAVPGMRNVCAYR